MTEKYKAPMPIDVQSGETYGWCSCGLSGTMPLCDGAHKTFICVRVVKQKMPRIVMAAIRAKVENGY